MAVYNGEIYSPYCKYSPAWLCTMEIHNHYFLCILPALLYTTKFQSMQPDTATWMEPGLAQLTTKTVCVILLKTVRILFKKKKLLLWEYQ